MKRSFINSFGLIVISLFELILVTYLYSAESFGIHISYLLVVTALSNPLGSVIGQITLREKFFKKNYFISFTLQVSLLSLIICFLAAISLSIKFYVLVALYPVMIYLSIAILSIDQDLIKRAEINKLNNGYFYSSLLCVFAILVFSFFDADFQYLYLVFAHVIRLVLFIVLTDIHWLKINRGVSNFFSKRKARYCLRLLVAYKSFVFSSLLGYFSQNIDRWFVSVILGPNFLAVYTRAQQLVNVPIVFFNRVISKDFQSLILKQLAHRFMLFKIITLCFVLSISAYFISDLVLSLFFKNEWSGVGYIVSVLILGLPFKVMFKYNDVFLRVKAKNNEYMFAYILCFLSALFVYFFVFIFYSEITYGTMAFSFLLQTILSSLLVYLVSRRICA